MDPEAIFAVLSVPRNVIEHSKLVAELALRIADACERRGLSVDRELIHVGALLHDIGRSKSHGLDHAILGAKLAKELGLPEPIIRIIERHLLAGLTKEEATAFGLPPADYLPSSLEEKIVAYADKLVQGSKVVSIEKTLRSLAKWLGPNHPILRRLRELDRELSFALQ